MNVFVASVTVFCKQGVFWKWSFQVSQPMARTEVRHRRLCWLVCPLSLSRCCAYAVQKDWYHPSVQSYAFACTYFCSQKNNSFYNFQLKEIQIPKTHLRSHTGTTAKHSICVKRNRSTASSFVERIHQDIRELRGRRAPSVEELDDGFMNV